MRLYALWVVAGILLLVWVLAIEGAIDAGASIHLALLGALGLVGATLVHRPHPV